MNNLKICLSLSLFFLLFSIFSYAKDGQIKDLSFFPKEKSVFINSLLETAKTDYESRAVLTNLNRQEFKEKKTLFKQSIAYTYFKDFYYGVSLPIYLTDKLETRTISTTQYSEEKRGGVSDPEFFLKKRFLNQEAHLVFLDFYAELSPSFFNAKYATSTLEGNSARGGHQIKFIPFVGQVYGDWQWMANFELDLLTERDRDNPNSGLEDYKLSSRTDFGVGIDFLIEMNSRLNFNPSLTVLHVGEETLTKNSSKTIIEGYTDVEVEAKLKIECLKDALLVSPYINLAFLSEQKYGTVVTYTGRDRYALGVELLYLF